VVSEERPASVVETAFDIVERKELPPGKNPRVAAFGRLGLLARLAEAASRLRRA